ncbi:hypothetical protein QBC45DRAFT_102518 [Copromyces sp. CBS 386.78]|nr:hypothetical protein QBC45DRAFT_102518 [Copromyces sp. CBS 386.78]
MSNSAAAEEGKVWESRAHVPITVVTVVLGLSMKYPPSSLLLSVKTFSLSIFRDYFFLVGRRLIQVACFFFFS